MHSILANFMVLWYLCLNCFTFLFFVMFCNLYYAFLSLFSFIEQDRVSGFWTWMFTLSKLPELGDTVFIVLRKQPLIFLHWYHHMTVLIYTWYSYTEYTSSARWFIFMNYCVHSLMYSYYALRAMGYSAPRSLAMVITICQLAQMVIGCVVNIWARQVVQAGLQECHISPTNIKLSLAMYFSYFVLFARFFQTVYFGNGKKSKGGTASGMAAVHDASSRLKAD
ncbi:hypothetical protein Cfor_05931 [Coptotermes formosanus]|uniref:Elongation of very long chain fatty acids protein n=1 Tax=Coptotermes formosanus TaxID=36987 RepID=A0A6L2PVJ1_COPFO|nr:hypothetical protein Cfor_05931 [Coptotermes formosanus]